MFKHHMKAADLPTVLKVKSYEQRLIIKELYHIQQEIVKNHNWLASYDNDPVPHLTAVAEKIKAQIKKPDADEKDAIRRLDSETRAQLKKATGCDIY
jgi:hypothetical protein